MYEHVYEHRIYMLHTYCRMQLDFSCKRQLQNPDFLVVVEDLM
jgi:hypothetical protein